MTDFLRLDDYNVPGYGLTVTGDLEIRTEDLSGETSGTARVDKGLKPKRLNVSLCIRFKDQNALRDLVRVVEARGRNGEGKVYTIANREANVAGIRQVRFTDKFDWKPISGIKAWSVSFTLREYLSVPERVEQRETKPEAVAQTSNGKTVTAETENTKNATKSKGATEPTGQSGQTGQSDATTDETAQTAQPAQEPLTSVEKILSWLDRALA
ncbi:MAG: DNA-binding protein [Desulfovibrio sp.]|uniref:baseplate complex protein n=1 Tax=Desulfovibrio sp. 7SRBS1 TaxID=3378064 RepID=UPI003B400A4B